jgi:ribonucleoside-diphosphate reductase alpha chain
MGILRIDHPDIEEFLDAKKQEGKLANFNLSVAVTDKFMQAVRKQGDTTGDLFELYDNHTKRVDREISATYLFNKIVNGLWSNGEPGVLFIDEINRKHPLRGLGEISGTNPCSEQPLLPNESCNLGSINLTKFCVPGRGGNLDDDIDWRALENTIEVAVRFLDDVITVNRYSVKDVEEATLRTRKIGLGVMGWADLLLMLGISYDSEVVTHLAEKVMEFIQHHALKASAYLAKERGAFPAFKDHYCFIDRPESLWQQEDLDWFALNNCIVQHGLRNACVTTIAPTGSLSLIAGCSSGIEPNFQWEYTYHRVDREFVEKHELAATYLESGKELPEYFVTALDIAPEWHLKMQSAFQKWVDAGISKTINLPTSATREEVADAIMLAWELKCKGVTLYRSGSRQQEVLVAKKPPVVEERRITPRKRPVTTSGDTMKIPVGDNCGSMFITVNHDETGPCECFINLGRSGGCISSHSEALGRLISLALRSGVDPSEIVDQLKGIRCSKVRWTEGKAVHSCADAVAYALEKMLGLDRTSGEHSAPLTSKDIELACDTLFRNRGKEFLALEEEMKLFGPDRKDPLTFRVIALGENPECSECHSILSVEGRCLSCRACGWTKCV